MRSWRAWVIWGLQTLLAALVLVLLWQPAITIAELKPQQNIIAVLVDDSRSMGISEDGHTREAQAVKRFRSGVLASLNRSFQTRLYRVDDVPARIDSLKDLQPNAPSTRIGDSLKQLSEETSDLPIGAVVLLSDGDDNTGGISADAINALRARHIPVHTVGFGRERAAHDVELDDVVVAPRALADSRLAAKITLHQRGYAGAKINLTVRDVSTGQAKILASRTVTLGTGRQPADRDLMFDIGGAGAKTLQIAAAPLPGEENTANNTLTRVVNVGSERAPHPLYRRRTALGVQVYPPGRRGRPHGADRLHGSHQRKQDLSPGNRRSQRTGRRLSLASGGSFRLPGIDHRVGGSRLFHSRPAGINPRIRGSPRRRPAAAGRPVLARRWRLERVESHRSVADHAADPGRHVSSRGRSQERHHAHHRRTRARRRRTASSRAWWTIPPANAAKWKTLPYLMDYEDPGTPKPGAAVLANMITPEGRKLPLLITENFGRGRTAIMATGGSWRWQMSLPLGDTAHDLFWQQLLRWLVSDTPGHVTASVPAQMLLDNGAVTLTADVRDQQYNPGSRCQGGSAYPGPERRQRAGRDDAGAR